MNLYYGGRGQQYTTDRRILDGRTERWTYRRTYGKMDIQTDVRMDLKTDGWRYREMDRLTYRRTDGWTYRLTDTENYKNRHAVKTCHKKANGNVNTLKTFHFFYFY